MGIVSSAMGDLARIRCDVVFCDFSDSAGLLSQIATPFILSRSLLPEDLPGADTRARQS